MTLMTETHAAFYTARDLRAVRLGLLLVALYVVVAVLSLGSGASGASLLNALTALLTGNDVDPRDALVLWEVRLPRLLLGTLIGAGLAVSGAVMQGIFRNPLADPGLIGVSSGAALGAVSMIVLGGLLPVLIIENVGRYLTAIGACIGGWAFTLVLYQTATRAGRTSVATMLLAGIALGALAFAMTGILIFVADERQLRDITFWSLGSLAGASWQKVGVTVPLICAALGAAPFLARGMNALALGEAAAMHIGVPVERLKRIAILSVAAAIGGAVAAAGVIGFIGLLVPHVLRLSVGPDHRFLLPNAALLGASLLLLADAVARTVVSPAELPIGIVTAVAGAPFFLWVVLKQRGTVDL